MNYLKKYFLIASCLIAFLGFTNNVSASTLYFLSTQNTFGSGQTFNIDLKINTNSSSINASQALITFPNDILELVEVDRNGSVFNFWVEEPTISNENGNLRFIGGTSKGISGASLQVLKLKFKSVGIGTAAININEGVVTANDGKGTNVLSEVKNTSVVVSTSGVKLESSVLAPSGAQEVKLPEVLTRTAVQATNLPSAPTLKVALYPDSTQWYNHLGEVVALWDVSDDVISIATKIDKNPNSDPSKIEKELTTGKNFGVLEEGIHYIHVKFRNNIGWGKIKHYKISIDTTAPKPFEIQIDNEAGDSPTPEIRFRTQDLLSGITEANIFIDGKGPTKTNENKITLPIQGPGKHKAIVRFFDLAGNSVEDDLDFEIIPLQTPVINFSTNAITQGEEIFASGKAIPNILIDAFLFNKNNEEVDKITVTSDELGSWEIKINNPQLARGAYTLKVLARDERGATSFLTEAKTVKIKTKIILTIGDFFDLTWFEIFIITLLFVVAFGGVAAWYYVSGKNKRDAYKIIAGRDLKNAYESLNLNLDELDKVLSEYKDIDQVALSKIENYIGKLRVIVTNLKKYLSKELEKIK